MHDKLSEDCVRGYCRSKDARWAKSFFKDNPGLLDEVLFGIYTGDRGDAGTLGEMSMRWIEVGGSSIPHLQVFCDAWLLLHKFQDVVAELAKVSRDDITSEQFCVILDSCGFVDQTPK